MTAHHLPGYHRRRAIRLLQDEQQRAEAQRLRAASLVMEEHLQAMRLMLHNGVLPACQPVDQADLFDAAPSADGQAHLLHTSLH